jgi:hypothetical protein
LQSLPRVTETKKTANMQRDSKDANLEYVQSKKCTHKKCIHKKIIYVGQNFIKLHNIYNQEVLM